MDTYHLEMVISLVVVHVYDIVKNMLKHGLLSLFHVLLLTFMPIN